MSFNGDDAGIEVGGSKRKKLEHPVSKDEPRPACQRHELRG